MKPTSRLLMIALVVSVCLHLAAVAMSLSKRPDLEVEGAGATTHAVLGQSPFNTILAGTVDQMATSQPLEPEVVEAEPVETVPPAETVKPDQPLQPVETPPVEVVTAPATAQPVRPLPQAAVPATLALAPTSARTYALPQTQQLEAATPPAAETLVPAEPEETIAREVAAETVTAEIETEPLESVAPQEIRPASAAKAVTQTATQPATQTTTQAAAPTVEPTPVSETAPADAQPVSQTLAQEVVAEVVTAEVEAEAVPTPMAKPPAPVRRKVEKKPAKSPARTAKNTETRKTASKVSSSSGSGGSAQATAQKGGSQRKGKGKTAGNSDVTNYPAKVQRKLMRAVRTPRGVRKARGNVVVHFTVRKNGSVSGVKLARSSGSAPFDQAVLKAVQRASPFPPIPDAARKKSWTFTLPVGMR